MSKPANHCDECKHFNYDTCAKGHRPRFYMPRNNNPHDPLQGYKRRCSDFTPTPPPTEDERSLLNRLFDRLFPWRR